MTHRNRSNARGPEEELRDRLEHLDRDLTQVELADIVRLKAPYQPVRGQDRQRGPFGFGIVASPRHADVLLVTGPVTTNMREALERTYQATPGPKWVVAVGDCARDGGVFSGSYACVGGVSAVLPVDPLRQCRQGPSCEREIDCHFCPRLGGGGSCASMYFCAWTT